MRLASRTAALAESATLRLSSEVARLRRSDVPVLSLLEGEPDLAAPSPVVDAVVSALRAGRTRYSDSSGLPELRSLISAKLKADNGIAAAPDDILVTNGAKQALYEALQALVGPGDEVLIPSPCWVTFPQAVTLAGAAPVLVESERLAEAITPRSRVIILNSPNNPTGKVCTEEYLKSVVDLAVKHDLVIISDEAYEGLVYDRLRHVSPAALGALAAERTVTVQTFSKSFAMTGFRVGYLTGPAEVVRAAARIHGHVTGNVCTFAQHGAVAALGLAAAERAERRAVFERRRDIAYALGSRLFPCDKPQGGLFLWVDARGRLGGKCPTSAALAARLLEDAKVAVLPGSACGGEGFLRISFSAAEDVLREGFARIERAL